MTTNRGGNFYANQPVPGQQSLVTYTGSPRSLVSWGFEDATVDNWSANANATLTTTVFWANSGLRSLAITLDASGQPWSAISPGVTCAAGQTCSAFANVYCSGALVSVHLDIRFVDGNGVIITTVTGPSNSVAANSNTPLSNSGMIVPDGAETMFIIVSVDDTGHSIGTTLYADDVTIPANVAFSLSPTTGVDNYGTPIPQGAQILTGAVHGGSLIPNTVPATALDFTFSVGGAKITFGSVAPSSPTTGDIWYDSTNGYRENQWNGTSWVPFQYGTNAIANNAITSAQILNGTIVTGDLAGTVTARALGGITTTISTTAPVSPVTDDLWINTTNGVIEQWSGSAWVVITFNAANAIQAATITTNQIAANTIAAGNIAAGAITTATINANAVTAAKIAANTITASQLAAGIVYAGIVNGTTVEGIYFISGTGSGTQWQSATPNSPGFFMYYDPGVTASTPGFPTSGTPVTNTNVYPVQVVISVGSVTNVVVNGVSVLTGDGTCYVPANGTITITYTGSPSWAWSQVPQLIFSISAAIGNDQWGNSWQGGATFVGLPGVLANTFTVTDTNNDTLANIDSTGNIGGQVINAAVDLQVGGVSVTNTVNSAPLGLVNYGYINSASGWPSTAINGGTEYALFELDQAVIAGRIYEFAMNPTVINIGGSVSPTVVHIYLRYTTDGSTPSTSSSLATECAITFPNQSSIDAGHDQSIGPMRCPFFATSNGTYRFLVTGTATSSATYQFKNDPYIRCTINDLGSSLVSGNNIVSLGVGGSGGGSGGGNSKQNYTEYFYAANSYSYYSNSGLRNTNGNMFHGAYSGEAPNYQYSYIGWAGGSSSGQPSSGQNLAWMLANTTINSASFRITNLHSWYDNGMSFGLHTSSTLGSTSWSAILNGSGGSFISEGNTFAYGLNSSEWTNMFASGAYTVLAPSSSQLTSLSWYGYFYGGGGSTSYMPRIQVNYTY